MTGHAAIAVIALGSAIVSGLAVEVVKWACKWSCKKLKRQLNYLKDFSRNIYNLKVEAEKLDAAIQALEGKVEIETNKVGDIVPAVKTWLRISKGIKAEIFWILIEAENVERSGFSELEARLSVSKRAKKTTDRAKELRDFRLESKVCCVSFQNGLAFIIGYYSKICTSRFRLSRAFIAAGAALAVMVLYPHQLSPLIQHTPR